MKLILAFILIVGIGVSYTNTVKGVKNLAIEKRKTIDTLKNELAEIRIVETENEEKICVLKLFNKSVKLNTTNIPNKFKVNGKKVLISGAIKETSTIEDEYGSYVWLNSIIVAH